MFAVKSWAQALDPAFGIPTDVAFSIIEDDDDDVCDNHFAVHKYFLAMVSPVFKAMFFGLSKETRDVVPIRGTSTEAFTLMVHHIYQKEIFWDDKDVILLLEVVNLAEMYHLEELMEEVQKPLAKYPLTPATVIEVASAAEMFSYFEEISTKLLSHCSIFLATQVLINKEEVTQFVSRYIDSPHYAIAFKLLEMAKEVPPVNCNNCMQVECEDRLPVNMENMKEGCRVFVRLGSSRMEVVGRLVGKCREQSGHLWWVREEEGDWEAVQEEEELMKVKLINLFFACKA